MSFIEGIGDEVTACFVILIVIALATLVTFIGSGYSERLHNASLIRPRPVVIVPETQSQQVLQRVPPSGSQENNSNSHQPYVQLRTSSESASPEVPETENPPAESLQSSADRNLYDQPQPFADNNHVPSHVDGTEDVLECSFDEPSEAHPMYEECETPTALPKEQNETESTAMGIRIRLKYLDDTERTVRSIPTTSIGEFKRNHFSEDLANNKIVRLIFCGHLLRDNSTLESHRVVDNSVIHVQILQAQTDQNRTPVSQNTELDLSHFLWPLLSVILVLCWLCYLKYPEYFSLVSTGILLLFSSGFVFFLGQALLR